MNARLDAQTLLRLVRGPASLRTRSGLYHARPVLLAAALGFSVAAYRAGVDTVSPLAAVATLLAVAALVSLCRRETPRDGLPVRPTPLQVGARVVVLALAFGLTQPFLTWLTAHHD